MKKIISILFIFSLCLSQARAQSIPCPCMNPPCSFWDWLKGVGQSVGGAIVDAANTMVDAIEDVANAVTDIFNSGNNQPDGEGFDEPTDGAGWDDAGTWWEPPMNPDEFYNPLSDPWMLPEGFGQDEATIAGLMDWLYNQYEEQGWTTPDCQGVYGGSAFYDNCGQCVAIPQQACQPYQLSAADLAIFNQMDLEDLQMLEEQNNPPPTLCRPTLQFGQYFVYGTWYHWLIQIDFMFGNPGTALEYQIPASGPNGGYGRADIAHPSTGRLFEIKPDNPGGLADGLAEVARYVAAANLSCPNPVPWIPGPVNTYATRTLQTGHPLYELEVRAMAPGVLGYQVKTRATPAPVVVPEDILDQMRDLIKRLKNAGSRMREEIAQFLREHPALVNYLKAAAYSAAIAVVIGTIIEDIATLGVGISDDFATFALAWRIVRFARAL